ncbi:MAG: tRNA U34 2-thiouridine synthase MnmA/TrmU [Cycloclasticus pugetii]|mgnify:FL=1|jgi:tRNA U34 2-thiouridine synthase MnmA/TrmU|uniref:tRNA (5-methylaminomethyl-2-thiouridylate)-methyltransferase n=1 Tax=Cycloclasticus zancles 78-ME TaxID=1198232 RepID=S5TC34_9GAMM|nr:MULTISPECIES: tRNA (5-methylaminomethyl-2-thiouridylate)-methyltransferase [Cycloclasticus]AFT66064.1 tRNA (5-methylaminomethyl-2-thiouridylate)-methyltransferase [Cycloclasticus sp. P1]AGS38367.1 tRNA (5-methylaminomethyl-2-thiouridylate)-methyltransferase [Cycloclasticus zancles 78-ME]MBV1897849.1 tRNA (5-methylaminomethyl-2-thiouridylate)-methyltransferase [Cycloclasticus sp.]MDF1829516.1 tRNA (5-methylaminomethyl-2-thiouridylate)-methyltransferase [Cycloclasticus pugetii]PHR50218.1 MAG:
MATQRKAVALISGGLDSLLAAKVMLEQGVHVEGINFYTGFCVEGHTHAIRKKDKAKPKRNNALWSAEKLGIKLHIIDIIEEYKDVLLNPKHGYGANMNPCLDCKIFMVGKAKEWAEENGFDFIITGEVIGQRPMSQRKETMPVISEESGADDLLLRPLCAQNLPETLPEREGWVNRDQLYDFSGRTRKPQMALAEKFGFDDYAQPAGGCCFLTDKAYSVKLTDLWASRGKRDYEIDDIMLLKVGRHIRPKPNFKLIVAREEGENNFLQGYKKQFITLRTMSHKGPLTLLDGTANDEDLKLAAQIVARFSQGRDAKTVDVEVTENGVNKNFTVTPLKADQIQDAWRV